MRLFISIALVVIIGSWLPLLLQSPILYALFTLPGTTLHELAHWITAFLLQGHPATFSIIPTWDTNGMSTLGHVEFHPTWYNAATVGLAPYLVAFPTIWCIIISTRVRLWWSIALCYVAACGYVAINPSPQDWNVATSQPLSFIPCIVIFLAVAYGHYLLLRTSIRATSRKRNRIELKHLQR